MTLDKEEIHIVAFSMGENGLFYVIFQECWYI